jgi:hypothetical protein|nr:MAG TPA: hypothetical protein [Caudoviricetes sp.]
MSTTTSSSAATCAIEAVATIAAALAAAAGPFDEALDTTAGTVVSLLDAAEAAAALDDIRRLAQAARPARRSAPVQELAGWIWVASDPAEAARRAIAAGPALIASHAWSAAADEAAWLSAEAAAEAEDEALAEAAAQAAATEATWDDILRRLAEATWAAE